MGLDNAMKCYTTDHITLLNINVLHFSVKMMYYILMILFVLFVHELLKLIARFFTN